MSLKDRFADFLNEIEQTEKGNTILVNMVEKLEKEQAEGWKKFDTDTHVLVKIETLDHITNTLDDLQYDAGRTLENAQEAVSAAEECKYHSEDLETKISDVKDDIEMLLNMKEEVTE